ncbi:30S ribosome-binding factor RbfA [Actinomycetospora corticicola]|uniref:Ribosome-binding factor A n=1 Tax=Actinomycetospora corticicola TaxID=663602 RepID=A0A7Y9J5Q7_9PSEU|nr:30S ribosome-binding factor RbfA [Actinomycetospora corticicola]NYD36415.1 ribosome-binding factor A [Actinomycetospora corticicola]
MADAPRARRLAKRIIQIVASTLEHEVKDPRLKLVTITDARITADLREATVYYTVYGDETDHDNSAAALTSATGVVRTAVGRQTGIRHTPSITFVQDEVPEDAARMEELLAGVRAADQEVASLAASADYAGEADPYRKPHEDDEDEDSDDLEAADDLVEADDGPDDGSARA